jgi:hypothetical protein
VRVLLGRRVLWWLISSCHEIRVACYKNTDEQIKVPCSKNTVMVLLPVHIRNDLCKNAFSHRSWIYGIIQKITDQKKITD